MRIGVLALQGSFAEHIHSFRRLDVPSPEVRLPADLEGLAGLVIPGGESTTISHLLNEFDLFAPLSRMIARGLPVWGTCAGMILLARESTDLPQTLSAIDIAVERNGWGRQIESYETEINIPAFGMPPFRAVFIRPPIVTRVGPEVERLAELESSVVAVRQGNVLATAFHPELADDLRFHSYFIQIVAAAGNGARSLESTALTSS
jgi:5'-phosphate synthase pdxT subunit